MALTNSPKTGLLISGAVGEEHYNSLLRQWRGIDALVQPTAKTFAVNDPGGSVSGDVHIVGAGTGAFAGRNNSFAIYNGVSWEFIAPKEGWEVWVEAEDAKYRYNGTAWAEVAEGGGGGVNPLPTGGTTGQLLAKNSGTNYDVEWVDPVVDTDNELPAGGTTGQVLAKNSGTDGDVEWVDPATAADESVIIQVALSDLDTALATKTIAAYVRAPKAFTLNEVRASLLTASSSGAVTVGIKASGTTVLSTNLTIDASENTSETAATPAVISDSSIADDEELRFEIIGAGTGAKGLIVTLLGTV